MRHIKRKFKEELNVSFIHSLNKFLVRTYYVPGTVLDTGGTIVNKNSHFICSHRTYNKGGKTEINQVILQMSV